MRRFHLLAVVVVVSGCAREPRIDGSSQERFGASLRAMRETLAEDQAEDLRAAVFLVVADEFGDLGDVAARLDGMTAAEVIEEAEGLRLSPMDQSALEAAEAAAERVKSP